MKKKKLLFISVFLIIILFGGLFFLWGKNQEKKLSAVEVNNSLYRMYLHIFGEFECSVDGVQYKEMTTNPMWLTKRIAFVRSYLPEKKGIYSYDYVDTLLQEYENFCDDGEGKKIINDFCNDCYEADYRADKERMSFDAVSDIIHLISSGNIEIKDGKVEHKRDSLGGFVSDDESIMKACKVYEQNRDLLHEWYINQYVQ